MKLLLFTSLVAIFGLTSSAPVADAALEARNNVKFYPSLAVNIFTPDKGTVKGDVYVFRTTQVGIQHETNSLLSIPFPSGYAGKICSFTFANGWAPSHTDWAPPGTNSNSQRVQLFSVGGPISATNTYTSRPYRNLSYGIFHVSDDGATGTWDGPTPTWPCPAAATTLGFEVVSQGDFCDVAWPLHQGLAVVVL